MAKEIDPWEWLEEGGDLPSGDPAHRAEALRICRFIEYGGSLHALFGRETLIECRQPDGDCVALMWVEKTQGGEIRAFCPTCNRGEMLIRNWERTPWAYGVMAPVPM